MTTRIELDDIRHRATINGVVITYELLEAFTKPTPPGVWFRAEKSKDSDVMIIRQMTLPRSRGSGQPQQQ
jgi:hypothetical protein